MGKRPNAPQSICGHSYKYVPLFIINLALSDWNAAPTQASVRRKLAEAEANDLAAGKDFSLDANISPAILIALGMDLEAEQ